MIQPLLLAALLSATEPPATPAAALAPAAAQALAAPLDDAWLEPALAALSARPAAPSAGQPRPPDPLAWLRRAGALAVDALPSSRPLRAPFPARRPVAGTLDATLLEVKGAAVLAMLEGYAGQVRLEAALGAARSSAPLSGGGTGPLLSALAITAGEEVADALEGFLDRPGAPLLTVTVRCEAGGARAVLAQTALAQPPGGSGGAGGSSRPTWVTPVCLRVGGPRGEATICALAGGPTAELKLPFCPAWLWSNAGGAGYYVSALPPRDLPALLPRLTAEERLALAVDAALLARRGALPLDDALALLGPLARDPDPRQTGAALLLAGLLEPRTLPTAELGRWRAFLRRTFGARARALGWLPRPDDGPATQPLRAALLPLVAGEGEEAVLAGEALALARRWLADRRQVPAEVAWPALRAAAYHGDQALFDQVLAQAGQAGTAEPHGTAEPRGPEERARLTALLGRFKEPGPAAAALRLALDPATAPGDAAGLLAEALSGRETRPAAVSALAGGWAGLQARLSEEEEARLVDALARPACQPADRAAVVALLGAAPGRAGGLRALALGLEEADACGAARGRQAQAVVRFLSRG